ncbi:hypothetical protein AB4028_11260 [Janibacter sp. RAF20_2_2]|uniref:hypothetical protein n=1 Tax=unclassified Janibacter TaxID=2649294 RepID=UPI003F915188
MSRPASPRRITAGLAAALTIPLAGCIPTLATDDPSSSATSATPTGAGRPVDEATLASVMPAATDLHPEWQDDTDGSPTSEVEKEDFSPPSCARTAAVGPEWEAMDQHERAEADHDYARPRGTYDTVDESLGLSITSYDQPYPTDLLDTRAEALADCPEYQLESDGEWVPYEVEHLSFPTLGDRTLAYRLVARFELGGSETWYATLDVVTVVVGHNRISVTSTALSGTPDPAISETAVRSVIDGLEQQP